MRSALWNPFGLCNYCNYEHPNPNDGCWKLHPELAPANSKKPRAAAPAQPQANARTNVTATDAGNYSTEPAPKGLFNSHSFASIAIATPTATPAQALATVLPTVIKKATYDTTYKQRYCYDTAAN